MKWIEQLGEANTDGVAPLASVSEQTLPWRADVVNDGGIQEAEVERRVVADQDRARALVLAHRAAHFLEDRGERLLLDTDAGKALGALATRWGKIPVRLVAIDRLDLPDARFASLGAPRDGAVPVSFHGLRS